MQKAALVVITLLSMSTAANAATVITSQDRSGVSVSTFHNGLFFTTSNGEPTFIVDAKKNSCEFFTDGYRVVGNCDEITKTMREARDQMMAGMSKRDQEMFAQMTKMNASQQAPRVTKDTPQVIANYKTACFVITGPQKRKACFSADLANQIRKEFDWDFMAKMQGGFSLGGPGMKDPAQETMIKLTKEGYPMLDMRESSGMPGMNAAVMNMLPEAQREEIMRKMGAGAGGKMEEMLRVTDVKTNTSAPAMPDTSGYQTTTFKEYFTNQMNRMGDHSGQR